MLLKLYQAGQPILRRHAKPVSRNVLTTKRTQEIIDFMIATLRDAPGVGLAAPQVGADLQIIIIEDLAKYHEQVPPEILKAQGRRPVPLKVLVNPQLTVLDTKPELWFEGCLSVDGYVAAVPRSKKVKVEALDRHGKQVSLIAGGWYARILQHEIDHLNGKLLVDRMKPESFMSAKNFSNLWRKAQSAKIEKAFGK